MNFLLRSKKRGRRFGFPKRDLLSSLVGAIGFLFFPACAFIPEDSIQNMSPGYAEMAEGLPETLDLSTLTGIGFVGPDHATTDYPQGLYLIQRNEDDSATFTSLTLVKDEANASAVSVTDFYDTPNAYVASVSGLYTDENDPLSDCTTLMIRKGDGKYFCARFQVVDNSERTLPAPVKVSATGLSFYLLGLWTEARAAAVASFTLPEAPEEESSEESEEEDVFRELSNVYLSAGEFTPNSEGEVLHSDLAAVADSGDIDPQMRLISSTATTSLATETGFCLTSGAGDDDEANFYWYTASETAFSLRKGTRSGSGAFTASTITPTFSAGPGTSTFAPGSISVSDPEPCRDGQIFSTSNAIYVVGIKTTVDGATTTTSPRLLQIGLLPGQISAVKDALDPLGDGTASDDDVSVIEAGKTLGDKIYLLLKFTGEQNYGLLVVDEDDTTPTTLTDENWISKGTYTFSSWRPSATGKLYFSGTKIVGESLIFGVKDSQAGAVIDLSSSAPKFTEFGLQNDTE